MFSNYIKYGIRYSLRYILKYIIRVIIFFGIIYFISFLSGKHLFIANVHALEPYNDIPDTISYWSGTSNSATDNVRQFNFYNTNFWGYSYQGATSMQGVSLNFNSDSYLDDKTGSVNFAIYSQVRNDWRKPFQVYIKDFYNNISSCYTDSTSIANNGSRTSSPISSVICPNVQIRGNYSIFISNLTPDTSLTIAISKVTFKFVTDKDIKSAIDNNTNSQEKTNNTIKDDNVDSSTNQGSSFFNDFDSGDEGSLTDIVSLPLEYVQHLNDTCQPFTIPTGKLGNISIPCLSSIWSGTSFAGIINTASLIINGIICYKLLTSLFLFFKELKDPDDDKVEVMNL